MASQKEQLKAPLVWKLIFKLVSLPLIDLVNDLFVLIHDAVSMSLLSEILKIFALKHPRGVFPTNIAFSVVFCAWLYPWYQLDIHI